MIKRNEAFTCLNCGKKVAPAKYGKCRNHCSYCLYSKHVDVEPGDRKHPCKGLMQPLKLETRTDGVYVLHECEQCKIKKWNKILEDDIIPLFLLNNRKSA